jgi:glucose-6-phosphate-specific signal transduction histidine kinase
VSLFAAVRTTQSSTCLTTSQESRWGYETAAVWGEGSGLVGLQDRVEALGATIAIDSVTGEGTCVAVTFPLATEAAQGIENFLDPPQELESPTR